MVAVAEPIADGAALIAAASLTYLKAPARRELTTIGREAPVEGGDAEMSGMEPSATRRATSIIYGVVRAFAIRKMIGGLRRALRFGLNLKTVGQNLRRIVMCETRVPLSYTRHQD